MTTGAAELQFRPVNLSEGDATLTVGILVF